MMPTVLKEWSSLKMRKVWRQLTGKQPAARATLATCGIARRRRPPNAPAVDAA